MAAPSDVPRIASMEESRVGMILAFLWLLVCQKSQHLVVTLKLPSTEIHESRILSSIYHEL